MEFLESILNYVLPIGGGITIGAIIVAIASVILKNGLSKTLNKVDLNEIQNKISTDVIASMKNLSFKQTIQPALASQLEKLNEIANERLEATCSDLQSRLDSLVIVLEALSKYFDNAVGVSDDTKAQLKSAIAEAKGFKIDPLIVEIEEEPALVKKEDVKEIVER